MRPDREKAVKLRLRGKSYGEIRSSLGVPKSTLSGWLGQIILSEGARKRIEDRSRAKSIAGLIKRNKQQTTLALARATEIRRGATSEVSRLSQEQLLLIGAALYWAEGYKRPKVRGGRELTSHAVSLTNSDPALVKVFLRFIREYCKVKEERIKASLRIFKHHNEGELLRFWQRETKIPMGNFRKSYYGVSRSSQWKRPINRLPYGVIQIIIADTKLFHRIMGYIEGIKNFVYADA